MRGGEASYGKKIFDVGDNALVAFAGLTGIRDDFLLLIKHEVAKVRPKSLYELKIAVEDTVFQLAERYKGRLEPGFENVHALLAGLEGLSSGKANLYQVLGGYGEQVDSICIGHGAEHAVTLFKFLYSPALPVADLALLAAFTIYWVGEDLDTVVGGSPDVFMLSNDARKISKLDSKATNQMKAKAVEMRENLRGSVLDRR